MTQSIEQFRTMLDAYNIALAMIDSSKSKEQTPLFHENQQFLLLTNAP
ncbi:hypothetical protein [Nostoc sphaeroides]|nr:hypothetical protein [Nostoc sphaeroides]